MPKKTLLRGSKITRSHTTFIDVAEPIIAAAKEMPEVKKVSLGIIKVTKCTPGIKVMGDGLGTLKVSIRSSSAIQTIWVYLHTPDMKQKVSDALTKLV